MRPRRWALLLISFIGLFAAGIAVGLGIYVNVDPARFKIDPSAAGVAAAGAAAILTGFLAVLGALGAAIIAGTVLIGEGNNQRLATDQAVLINRRRELVGNLIVQSNRHAQDMRRQHAAWVQEPSHRPTAPDIRTSAELDAIGNELYAYGFQVTGDAAHLHLLSLIHMEGFTYLAEASPTAESTADFHGWVQVQILLKTRLIDASLVDQGRTKLVPANRHWEAEVLELHKQAMGAVLITNRLIGAIRSDETTAS